MLTISLFYKNLSLRYYWIMLPKQYRLKKRTAFNATYRLRNSFYKDGITVFYGKKNEKSIPTKIGFVVSKKIHKRAVKRNRIKRLMRESVRLYIKNTQDFENKYISLIFVASAKLLNKSFNEINKSILKIMESL